MSAAPESALPKHWHLWPRRDRRAWLDAHPEIGQRERLTLAIRRLTDAERYELKREMFAALPLHKRALRWLRQSRA